MRRRIELYINGSQADLSDQGLVLFNYAYTDLENPTAVKNSYSKQVTLPGTDNNAAIFGHLSRMDRVTGGGFSPLVRTPFTIYNELGEIIKSGYLKLDQVVRRGSVVTGYKVSLYGGLGSFLYALSYDENGDKLTLADLTYLDGAIDELDFKITAANVRAAWTRVSSTPEEYDSIWDVINFAPAYNGVPDGDFDPSKGIASASNLGLETGIVVDGKTYNPNGGNVLINLAQPHTEWDVKDLRCYLQRPILSMRAFLVALEKWATAKGYTFDYSDIPVNQYRVLWKTLPMIPSLGSFKQDSGELSPTYTCGIVTSGDVLACRASFSGVTANMEVTARINSVMLAFQSPSTHANPAYLYTRFHPSYSRDEYGYHTIIFVQAIGYSGNTIVAYSPARCFATGEMIDVYGSGTRIAELVGYTPLGGVECESAAQKLNNLFLASDSHLGYFNYFYPGAFEVKGNTPIDNIRIAVKSFGAYGIYRNNTQQAGPASYLPFSLLSAGDTGVLPHWYQTPNTYNTLTAVGASWASPTASASYRSTSNLRSGALVEKAKLLSSKHTPADYLLSLGVQFGWVFKYDEVEKKFTITTRNAFFNTGKPAIDLTDMVDRSKDIIIAPSYAGARIYEFVPEIAEGHFAQEYANIYGVQYGIQRVDTGYQFDSSPQNLLAKSAFRAAATILEHGPYWNYITYGGRLMPSVFLDKGNKYTMWTTDGTNKEFDIPIPPNSATIAYVNDYNHEGYDSEFAWKLDLHDADGKGLDGEDILVYYSGIDTYDHFRVSDDTAAMLAINNNKPCWDLNPYSSSTRIANFHRYDTDTEWMVEASLDFGTPKEIDAPFINFDENSSAYIRHWAAFIRDRYNQDTKVMKCRVNFHGLQVGPELLRRFFYYEGVYWVLNKISNYSLTTWDPVECEFIQVQDMDNYTNGQILE